MYSEKWKRNVLTMSSLMDFVIIGKSFIIKVIIQGTMKNENNKEILQKFNLD